MTGCMDGEMKLSSNAATEERICVLPHGAELRGIDACWLRVESGRISAAGALVPPIVKIRLNAFMRTGKVSGAGIRAQLPPVSFRSKVVHAQHRSRHVGL
jgi:hypothetical protein